MKVSIEEVESMLLEKKIDPNKVQEIIRDLNKVVEEEKEEVAGEKPPKQKWEHIIILNDPNNQIKEEIMGWVVQQQQDQDAGLIIGKLQDAMKAHNETVRKKKHLIDKFTDLFGVIKGKFVKEKGLRIKTKEAVRVLVLNKP